MDDKPFTPDWVSPPGDTIRDLLKEKGITKEEFAEKIGYTLGAVKSLLRGRSVITEWLAQRLSETLGSTKEFWLRREKQYRESLKTKEASHGETKRSGGDDH